MRIGILGDIHSNLEALEAVVAAMKADGVEHWVQVGDIVGYGPDPRACMDMVRDLGCVVCMGNHDAAVVGLLNTDYFNAYARMAIEWTRTQLRRMDLDYLGGLPLVVKNEHYTVVHGTMHMPEQFGYVLTLVEAIESMRHQDTLMCFVGHSHVPAIYLMPDDDDHDIRAVHAPPFELTAEGARKVLVNVGSVGQPRDENRDAAYAIFDSETLEILIRRVPYDIEKVQGKIRSAGLPGVLADRLAIGV